VSAAPGADPDVNRVDLPTTVELLRIAAAVSALSAVIHLASSAILPGFIHPNDSFSYLVPAESLLRTHSFLDQSGHPMTFRTPGYPLFLAVFFALGLKVPAVIYVQHLVAALLAGAAAMASRVALRSRVPGWTAGLLVGTDIATLQFANLVMSEILATVAVTAAVVFAYIAASNGKRRFAVLAGVMCAAGTLIRPVGIFLGVALGVFIVFRSRTTATRRLGTAGVIVGLSLALLAPWVIRNYLETGHSILSSVAGINMLEYRAAGVLAAADSGDFEANRVRHRDALLRQACAEVERSLGRPCEQTSYADRAAVYSRMGTELILDHPAGYAKSAARGVAMMLFGDSASSVASAAHISQRNAKLICVALMLPIFVLAVIGSVWVLRQNADVAYLLFIVISYFVVVSAGPEADSRFRIPFMPCYAVLASGGVAYALSWWRRGTKVVATDRAQKRGS